MFLTNEARQRDTFLNKARNLVMTLNEECSRNTNLLKDLSRIESECLNLKKENEKLKETIQKLQNDKITKKNEDFSIKNGEFIEADSFACKSPLKFQKNLIDSDVAYLENEITNRNIELNEVHSENIRLNDYIKNLESKYSAIQDEKQELGNNLIRSYETIEEYRYKQTQVEQDLKKYSEAKYNQNIEDLSKLLIQKENLITELSAQVINTHKHKKHRHSIRSKEIFDLVQAIKQEISLEKYGCLELGKESSSAFKDFQTWHKNYQNNAKIEVFEEIFSMFLEISYGKTKDDIRLLLNTIHSLDLQYLNEQIFFYIKQLYGNKQEIESLIVNLKNSLDLGIDSIELVTKKLQEIRKVAKGSSSELSLKVIDLSLSFLKNFAKERESDYEISCSVMKIMGIV